MSDAKIHIKYSVVLYAVLTLVFIIFGIESYHIEEIILVIVLGLLCSVIFSLTADFDHKGSTATWTALNISYFSFLAGFLMEKWGFLLEFARMLQIIMGTSLSLGIILPQFLKHRGLMHTTWVILPVCALSMIILPSMMGIYLSTVIFVAHWTHIYLDGYFLGIKLTPKVVMPKV